MELKKLMLSDLIDGEMIIGAAIIDSNNIPIIYHLPTTLTLKSLRNVISLLEVAQRARRLSDELLGPFNYILVKYANFKVAFFNISDKGWLMVFVNPVWHVENALPKIRQFIVKIYKLI